MAEKEYIERESLINAIKEARPLNWNDSEAELTGQADFEIFENLVKSQPAADVQEVVRCKDCIHICLHSSGDFYCSITGTEYKSYELDHYCSYGAKMDKG